MSIFKENLRLRLNISFLRFKRDRVNRCFFYLILVLFLLGLQAQYNIFTCLIEFILPILKDRLSIAIMALAVSCCSIFFGYLTFRRTTEKSVEDDYWLRTVLLPGYLDVLKVFIDEISDEVRKNDELIYKTEWWYNIQDRMSRKAQLIGIHSDSIYKNIVKLMGFFEDDLNRVFEKDSYDKDIEVEQLAIGLFRKIMLEIKTEQHNQIRLLRKSKKRQT